MRSIIAAGILTAFFAAPGWADAGHSHGDERAYGEPGDPKKAFRTVVVTMREVDDKMIFVPSEIVARRGEQIKFMLTNHGEVDHEIVLATLDENLKHAEEMKKNPDMEHDDPNAKRLSPRTSAEMLWKFTKKGEFDFSCLIPGHREMGMFGKIVVK